MSSLDSRQATLLLLFEVADTYIEPQPLDKLTDENCGEDDDERTVENFNGL